MARITVDIDQSILNELGSLAKAQNESISRVITELVAEALHRREKQAVRPALRWHSQPMHELVDLENRAALEAVLNRYDDS